MRLTKQDANLEKNLNAWEKNGLTALLIDSNLLFVEIATDDWDGYDVFGDLLDHLMANHPIVKNSWNTMTTDEKWNFVEFVWYGIRPLVCAGMGFKQVEDRISGKELINKNNLAKQFEKAAGAR